MTPTIRVNALYIAASQFSISHLKTLWSSSSGVYLRDGQSVNLSEPVSEQHRGIVLHWQYYNNGVEDHNHNYFFVPKSQINGTGVTMMGLVSSYFFKKYVYVMDDKITGNADNDQVKTLSGVQFNNNKVVLTEVLGVQFSISQVAATTNTATIADNSVAQLTANFDVPDGYSIISIIGYRTNQITMLGIDGITISGNTATVVVRNHGASRSAYATITALIAKVQHHRLVGKNKTPTSMFDTNVELPALTKFAEMFPFASLIILLGAICHSDVIKLATPA